MANIGSTIRMYFVDSHSCIYLGLVSWKKKMSYGFCDKCGGATKGYNDEFPPRHLCWCNQTKFDKFIRRLPCFFGSHIWEEREDCNGNYICEVCKKCKRELYE